MRCAVRSVLDEAATDCPTPGLLVAYSNGAEVLHELLRQPADVDPLDWLRAERGLAVAVVCLEQVLALPSPFR